MRISEFLFIFLILISPIFASNLNNMALQISKDPTLLIIYGKNLQALPVIENLPSPEVTLLNDPDYIEFFEKTQELSKLRGTLNSFGTTFVEEGTDMQNHHLKHLITDLFFLIHDTDDSQIQKSLIIRDQYVNLYNDLANFNTAAFFSKISTTQNLEEFSGRITINGKTFSLLESNSKQIQKYPLPKTTAELLPPSMYFTESLCTFRLIGSSYHLDITAPKYFAITYLLGPPLICENNVFVSQNLAETFVENLRFSKGHLAEIQNHLSDFSNFLTGANNYLNSRREAIFLDFEKTKEEIEALQLSGISALNSSEVISALQLVQTSKGLSAVLSVEDPLSPLENSSTELQRVQNLLTYCTSPGNCLINQDLADNLLGKIKIDTKFLARNFKDFQKLFQEKCEFYVKSTDSDIQCEFIGPQGTTIKQTARALLEAHANYLIMTNELKLAQSDLKNFYNLKLDEIETLLFDIEPYLSRNDLITYYSDLSNLYDQVISTSNPTDLQKILPKIKDLDFKIKKDFFIDNADEAEELRLKLFWYLDNPEFSTTPLDLEIPLFLETPVSANSDFVPKLIFLLNSREKILALEKNYHTLFEEYLNNIPTNLTCLPEVPPLGKEFEALCTISFENTYPDILKEAFITENLPFPATKSLDSRNAISGDLSHIKSLVAKTSDLKLSLENIQDHFSIQLKYTALLPMTPFNIYNETTFGTTHEIYFRIFPECPTTKAYLFMKHPISNLKLNSSHNYFLSGDEIAVEVFCNQPDFLRFSAEIISVETQGDLLIIKNHFEKPIQTNLTFENTLGLSINSSFRIEDDKFIIPLELEDTEVFRISKSVEETNVEVDAAPPFEGVIPSLINATPSQESAKTALELMAPRRLGCVEPEIVKSVSQKFNVPEIECIVLGESTYQQALTLFESEDYNGVLELYNHLPTFREAEFYLSNALNYESDATVELKLAEKSLDSPLAKRRAEPYFEMAQASFSQGDFVSAIYYAKFTVLQAPIGLAINWRIILAVVIIGVGLWSQTRKKKEIMF